jgi:RHH-type proline utilization regulon transcriptional repressor/proline dehydrogenase/delta 1-pyrroline-5-carboxylate dehydrogenase
MLRTDDVALMARAELLAERLLRDAERRRNRRERTQGRRIARMLDDPGGLAFILALTDEVLRMRDPRRAARHLRSLVTSAGSGFLGPVDRRLLEVGSAMAERLPTVVMPLVRRRVRAELAGFVIPAEPGPLARHIARRRAEHTRLNINVLGEAVLGEAEAQGRLGAVLGVLERPDVEYVSVKVSSVCSQLHVVAFDHEVERVAARVALLYDAAAAHRPPKFVNLDMEEYRDLDLTVAVFRRLLDEERYARLDAGIVLQAYLPDSLAVLTELITWARRRHDRYGSTIKVRIVKGANLAMEQVEAELAGWVQAPFATKAEVDANYKRMLDVALDPANAGALRVGVASHNLFEVAWALTVSRDRGVADMVEMEMLEGMAPSLAAAVREEAGNLLLYAPIARRQDSESVIAYLVRRFDENTGPDNFLRNQFSLWVGSRSWAAERDRFRASVVHRHDPVATTRRTQDRAAEAAAGSGAPGPGAEPHAGGFANVADTDFSRAPNRRWISAWLHQPAVPERVVPERVGPQHAAPAHAAPAPAAGAVVPVVPVVPAVVAGATVETGPLVDGFDPAGTGVPTYRWVAADETLVERAVDSARAAGSRWRSLDPGVRRQVLCDVAAALDADRGHLVSVMARDGGKTVEEADPEVSEAVDFANYYAESISRLDELGRQGAVFDPFGTVVVVPPWNFPLAIPAGGVTAALAAGNAVILKPAPETVATAWALAQACWRGGVPRELLQFLPCRDDDAGRCLITHPGVDAVILTGAWDTARMFLGWRPELRLHAETSGKNAIVVTAAADLDEAIADIVRSAFGHAGQKCSAASLAIVEASVYDDPAFRRQLADAVRSLRPGPGTDLRTTIGPLIRAPEGPLHDALHHLHPGETWLVRPAMIDGNPRLWSPGVKLGVAPGSPFHLTECFGPVLGVMRAADLTEAIAWQNQPAYGLTAGLQSLDPAEIGEWRERVEAGNLYVNRHITGAVVRRQPFGGWKRSSVGPAAKAGGPNYVASLGTWEARFEGTPAAFGAAVEQVWRHELSPSDPSGLVSEADVLRYRPLRTVLLRVGAGCPDREAALAAAAGAAVGVRVTVSSAAPLPGRGPLPPTDAPVIETDDELAARLAEPSNRSIDKIRFLGPVTNRLRLAAHDAGIWVDDTAVVGEPRLEVLRWVREQALSETRHRHGNISPRHAWPARR